jgi:hypothetical protein
MRRLRTVGAVAALTALPLGMAGCDIERLVTPCFSEKENNISLGIETLDGSVWNLVSIAGVPIGNGYSVPGKGTIYGGSLRFTTTSKYYNDKCTKLETSRGTVVANYDAQGTGEARRKSAYAGTFTVEHKPGDVTLAAAGKAAGGKLSGPLSTRTLEATYEVKIKFLGEDLPGAPLKFVFRESF